jgi:hypothetical protein
MLHTTSPATSGHSLPLPATAAAELVTTAPVAAQLLRQPTTTAGLSTPQQHESPTRSASEQSNMSFGTSSDDLDFIALISEIDDRTSAPVLRSVAEGPGTDTDTAVNTSVALDSTAAVAQFFAVQRSSNVPERPTVNDRVRVKVIDHLCTKAGHWLQTDPTLHRAVDIFDRVLQVEAVSRGMAEVVGVACLLIASKIEDVREYQLTPRKCVEVCDGLFPPYMFVDAEQRIANLLTFRFARPTAFVFATQLLAALEVNAADDLRPLTYFCVELASYSVVLTGSFSKCEIACAALIVANGAVSSCGDASLDDSAVAGALWPESHARAANKTSAADRSRVLDAARALSGAALVITPGTTAIKSVLAKYGSAAYASVATRYTLPCHL